MESDSDYSLTQDNEQLIGQIGLSRYPPGGSARSIIMKSISLLFFFICIAARTPSEITAFFTLSMSLLELWISKNCDGLELVGMRWSHEIGDSGEARWVYYSRPDPYVPNAADSNIFWIGLYGSLVAWIAVFLWSAFSFGFFNTVIVILVVAAQLANTIGFVRCHGVSTRQAEDVARIVLLGDNFDSDELEKEEKEDNKDNVEEKPPIPHPNNNDRHRPALELPIRHTLNTPSRSISAPILDQQS